MCEKGYGSQGGVREMSDPGEPDFPSWLPGPAAEAARELLTFLPPPDSGVVRRLATDPRMETVWVTLKSRRRTGHEPTIYQYSAAPDWLPAELRGPLQKAAMRKLFISAAASISGVPPAITQTHVHELRQPYLDLAEQLRTDIKRLRALSVGKKAELEVLDGLATECRLRADVIERHEGQVVTERDGGDMKRRAYLTALAGDAKKLFGNTLYGTVAKIATVALDQKITVAMVREATK